MYCAKTDPYLGLEPVDKLDNVRVLEALEHVELVKHHALVAADVPLQDDLDGDAAVRAVGLPDDAIGAGAEGAAEAVLGSELLVWWLAPDAAEGGGRGEWLVVATAPHALLLVALGLPVKAVEHGRDCK